MCDCGGGDGAGDGGVKGVGVVWCGLESVTDTRGTAGSSPLRPARGISVFWAVVPWPEPSLTRQKYAMVA